MLRLLKSRLGSYDCLNTDRVKDSAMNLLCAWCSTSRRLEFFHAIPCCSVGSRCSFSIHHDSGLVRIAG